MNHLLLMSESTLWTLMFIIPLAIFAIGLTIYFIFQYPKDKAKEQARKQAFYEECEKEPEYDFKQAKVLCKKKDTYYKQELRMIEVPTRKEEYFITFLTEDGTEQTYPVRVEMYEQIEEGQEGTLVTVNGNFFDFGDGEEIPPEALEENN